MDGGRNLIEQLRRICGDEHVVTEHHALSTYESDGLLQYAAHPVAVVLPGSAEEVAAVVRACHEAGVPWVARGAGSGLSVGALPVEEGLLTLHIAGPYDATTGKPVPGATIFNTDTGEMVVTDDEGNFEFVTSEGPANLVVIDPSYAKTPQRFDGEHAVTITLEPVSVRGEEILVEAERERTSSGETTMKREEIARVPGSRGDALAAVKNLPGVANTQGFGPNAGLVIRF